MKIVCDACSAKYSIADEKVRGKVFKIRCKKCSNIIVVRGSSGADAGAQPAATYDQKETKVFDYSGYDNPSDAAAASDAGSADAIWHVVIDQEQVGPMTAEEVGARFSRGDLDADSYVWCEGFADWERLADIDVFAALAAGGGGGGGMEENAGLFGGAPIDDGRTAQSDPADLFAAHVGAGVGAGGGGEDDGGGDLFAGGGGGEAAEEGGLFGGGAAVAASSAPQPAADAGGGGGSLTGQRNENSVLFSLNNLAALASDAPRAPAPSSSSPSAGPSPSGGGPANEGSGLIDIRSMAQVYLGDNKQQSSPMASGSADDLPVFSQTSFEAASPVLLPTAQAPVNNRLLIALIGLIGVLVIAAVILVVVVLRGGGEKKQDRLASNDVAGTAGAAGDETGDTADKGTQPAAAADTAATGGQPAAAAATGSNDSADSAGSSGNAGDSGDKAAAAAPDKHASSSSHSSSHSSHHTDHHSSDRHSSDHHAAATSHSEPVHTTKPEPDPTSSSACDEVACLVDPDKPCCRKGHHSSSSSSHSSSSASSNLPDRPSRSDVSSGIGRVKGRVASCSSKGSGTVTVKIHIAPSGSVSGASASGGSPALQSCVKRAVRGAHFARTKYGISVNYPFIF